jgi:hypothetical protein
VGAGEGHAVIGADRFGQAKVLESALEDDEGVGFLGGCQRLASNEVATGEVADSQWVAVAAIGEHELAFVVGAPQIIGHARLRQAGALSFVMATPATATDQAMAIEDGKHGADRW